MKSALVTALAHEGELGQQTMAELKRYGLSPQGHFWVDDLPKFAWLDVLRAMKEQPPALWTILASVKTLAEPNLRYGLSLLTLTARTHLGPLPTVILSNATESLTPDMGPAVLGNASYLSLATPAWQAKLVALANSRPRAVASEYYFDVHGHPTAGQWFEVGPTTETWKGALFAAAGAEIDFQAVGLRGKLPERATVSEQQKGLKLDANGVEHTAWALRNPIEPGESHFIRVRGEPSSLLFGSYPEGDSSDFFTLKLK